MMNMHDILDGYVWMSRFIISDTCELNFNSLSLIIYSAWVYFLCYFSPCTYGFTLHANFQVIVENSITKEQSLIWKHFHNNFQLVSSYPSFQNLLNENTLKEWVAFKKKQMQPMGLQFQNIMKLFHWKTLVKLQNAPSNFIQN